MIMNVSVYNITASNGIKILDIIYDVNDKVKYCWFNDKGDEKPKIAQIYVNNKGDSYFKVNGKRYYIHEFIKI